VQVVAEAQDTPLRTRFSTPRLGVGTIAELKAGRHDPA
jgi:hypothetical protein